MFNQHVSHWRLPTIIVKYGLSKKYSSTRCLGHPILLKIRSALRDCASHEIGLKSASPESSCSLRCDRFVERSHLLYTLGWYWKTFVIKILRLRNFMLRPTKRTVVAACAMANWQLGIDNSTQPNVAYVALRKSFRVILITYSIMRLNISETERVFWHGNNRPNFTPWPLYIACCDY